MLGAVYVLTQLSTSSQSTSFFGLQRHMGPAHPPALDMLGMRGVSPLALPEARGLRPLANPLESLCEALGQDT